MRCKTCHYDLSKLTKHRCPECGGAFDPNNPETFERPNRMKWFDDVFKCAFCILMGVGLPFEFLTRISRPSQGFGFRGALAMVIVTALLAAPLIGAAVFASRALRRSRETD